MRRFLLLLFYFSVFPFFRFSVISAQDFDFNRAFQDYLYNFNLYRSSSLDYISAKNSYLNYKTLTSQTKAQEATQKILLVRAETIKTYLTAIRMKLKETTKIINYQENLAYIRLDTEVTWLTAHKKSFPTTASLEDWLKLSSQLEERYPEMEVLAYQTLGLALQGKENSLREKINEQITKIEAKIAQIEEDGEETALLEQWLIQAKEKIKRSQEKEKEAQNLLSQLKPNDSNKREVWNKTQKVLEEENQFLKEAVSNLKEILREIKRA